MSGEEKILERLERYDRLFQKFDNALLWIRESQNQTQQAQVEASIFQKQMGWDLSRIAGAVDQVQRKVNRESAAQESMERSRLTALEDEVAALKNTVKNLTKEIENLKKEQ